MSRDFNLGLTILFFKMFVIIVLDLLIFPVPEKLHLPNRHTLTHEILLYEKIKFFIPPEDSKDISCSIHVKKELTVGNCRETKPLYYSD